MLRPYDISPGSGLGEDFAVFTGNLTAQYGADDTAFEGLAFPRTPLAAGVQFFGTDSPFEVGIDFNVRVGLIGQVKDAFDVGVHTQGDVVEREAAIVHRAEEESQGSFEAGESGRRIAGFFFGLGVRRVVGCEAVDGGHVLPEGEAI